MYRMAFSALPQQDFRPSRSVITRGSAKASDCRVAKLCGGNDNEHRQLCFRDAPSHFAEYPDGNKTNTYSYASDLHDSMYLQPTEPHTRQDVATVAPSEFRRDRSDDSKVNFILQDSMTISPNSNATLRNEQRQAEKQVACVTPQAISARAPVRPNTKSTYKYFPTDQARATQDWYQPKYKRTVVVCREDDSRDWEKQMLENQRLRLTLRTLGKAAENYATHMCRLDKINAASEDPSLSATVITPTRASIATTLRCESQAQEPQCVVVSNTCPRETAVAAQSQEHYTSMPISVSRCADPVCTCPSNIMSKRRKQKLFNVVVDEKPDTSPIVIETVRQRSRNPPPKDMSGIRHLVEQHGQLMREKERLERRLCFQLEDRAAECKQRGFSRPLQYQIL